jgi:hypothetical protein
MRYRATRRGLVAGGAVALAGCGLLPEEPDPIEATATTAADLPEAAAGEAGYSLETEDERTVETTVTAELTGDVQTTARRDVTATVFRRIYAGDGPGRFGVVTAPLVDLLDGQGLFRDPFLSLDDAGTVEHATGLTVGDLEPDGETSVALLGTEIAGERFRGSTEGTAIDVLRASVHDGEDGVTAIAAVPEGETPPALFDDVRRDE